MADQPTCGQGLAAHSVLPTKLGELTAAVADVLEAHTKALLLDDENARRERRAYVSLIEAHRRTAADLLAIAQGMSGYRDLPMARHDPNVMSSAAPADALARFVKIEWELLAFLQERVEKDRAMLAEMGRAR
jgi:hypothetical protein